VVRVAVAGSFEGVVAGKTFVAIEIHGPFLRCQLSEQYDLIINLMLAGRLQHQRQGEKGEGYLCCSFLLDDDSCLNLCDDQLMAKLYLVKTGDYSAVPKYSPQGIDILSSGFTVDVFRGLAAQHKRKQVRVFINDHTLLSSIGNAYADEILFDARIHPKTFLGKLSSEELHQLYSSIRSVMEWGLAKVTEAGKPVHTKVREHMKVRNRHGKPCPRCGTTIRREGVRGYDVYFCPACQPGSRKLFINWTKSK
jgi:formamidopyrimidine-DNA glycosylase